MQAETSRYHAVHATPRGANDARPTALQIIHDEKLEGKWADKTVLITGGNASIGAETARALHATGATVYIAVRDAAKGHKAITNILKSDPTNKAPINMVSINLDDLDSVRQGAAEFLKQSGNKLNVLICNAGIMAAPFGQTADGFESQFATNYLSHFLLFQLLKPALLASSTPEFNSRVVMLTSESHRQGEVRFDDIHFSQGGYHPMVAYGQSKTATIWMANAIDRLYGGQGLHALSLHPGAIKSNITAHVHKLAAVMWEIASIKSREKSTAQGAATTVWAACSSDWEGKGGKYLSNCMVAAPFKGVESIEIMDDGYAPWAYSPEKEDRLWAESLKMVGLEQER